MCISAVFQQCFVPSFKIGQCQAWILLCPEQDAGLFVILVTFFSGHLFVALRFCSSWELFPSHRSLSRWWQLFQQDWTISTFPIFASCHWETDHLGGTDVSSEWWEVVNSFYFCLSFVFPLFSTRLSVHFRHWENIVAGFCSDLLVQSLFFQCWDTDLSNSEVSSWSLQGIRSVPTEGEMEGWCFLHSPVSRFPGSRAGRRNWGESSSSAWEESVSLLETAVLWRIMKNSWNKPRLLEKRFRVSTGSFHHSRHDFAANPAFSLFWKQRYLSAIIAELGRAQLR